MGLYDRFWPEMTGCLNQDWEGFNGFMGEGKVVPTPGYSEYIPRLTRVCPEYIPSLDRTQVKLGMNLRRTGVNGEGG